MKQTVEDFACVVWELADRGFAEMVHRAFAALDEVGQGLSFVGFIYPIQLNYAPSVIAFLSRNLAFVADHILSSKKTEMVCVVRMYLACFKGINQARVNDYANRANQLLEKSKVLLVPIGGVIERLKLGLHHPPFPSVLGRNSRIRSGIVAGPELQFQRRKLFDPLLAKFA